MKLNVNEIFYSLQGEGARSGEASIFIRLTSCNLACDFCDTDFATGTDMQLEYILSSIAQYPCQWIIWTGGEPTLQLQNEHLLFFKEKGYKQAIETNGTKQVPSLIDYITCSPKKNFEELRKKNATVDEIRLAIKKGDPLPDILQLPIAKKYFISPIFDANKPNFENINYCVNLVKQNPKWRLSLQIHKLIEIA